MLFFNYLHHDLAGFDALKGLLKCLFGAELASRLLQTFLLFTFFQRLETAVVAEGLLGLLSLPLTRRQSGPERTFGLEIAHGDLLVGHLLRDLLVHPLQVVQLKDILLLEGLPLWNNRWSFSFIPVLQILDKLEHDVFA